MSGHTPGPWAWTDRELITVVGAEVVLVHGWDAIGRSDANARLIAAAPDLLEALRVAEEQLDAAVQNYATGEEDKTLAIVRAAIAKATGATS